MTAKPRRNNARLIPALIAGSACGLASAPSSALQLGELEIQSALGQPLRASIAVALSPNEQLFGYCVLLKPGVSSDGLHMLSRATVTIADGSINLAGTRPLREPLLAMQVSVDCPYTANITRSYTVMLDPAQVAETIATQTNDAAPEAAGLIPNTGTTAPTVRRTLPSASTDPIAPGTAYRVRVGDSVSVIASRIENRPIGLWPAVDAIFAANPKAFIDGDINKLKAGSMLNIPALDGLKLPTLADTAPGAELELLGEIATDTFVSGSAYQAGQSIPNLEIAAPGSESISDVSTAISQEPVAPSDTVQSLPTNIDTSTITTIQPGDISIGGDTTFVSPIESTATAEPTTSAPDAVIDQTTPAAAVITGSPAAAGTSSSAWSWLFWLAGSGVALILGLVVFGRTIRDRFGSAAVAVPVHPAHEDLEITARNEALSEELIGGVDFQVEDSQQSNNEYTLDADLGAGTGLNDNSDMHVAENFTFSPEGDISANLDMELPEEPAEQPEKNPTDIIPPQPVEEASILDEEILPIDDDNYDMSMIVDATMQNLDDYNATEKDLHAVPLAIVPSDDDTNGFTINESLAADVLEQDYEDELTATQAANQEIERVAIELAHRMDESGDDQTAEIPQASSEDEPTAEVTVQMPGAAEAENDDFLNIDDTDVNENLAARLPDAENDATAEMEIESGRLNTKNS